MARGQGSASPPYPHSARTLRALDPISAAAGQPDTGSQRRGAWLLGGYGRSMSYGAYLNVYICTLGVEVLGATAYVPSAGGPYSEGCTL